MSRSQNSLLWEISGNGLRSSSWLYGTIHLGDARFIDLTPEAKNALDSSGMFLMELSMDSIDPLDLLNSIQVGEGYSLKEKIDPGSYEFLKDHFTREIGLPISFFDNTYPVFVSFFLSEALMVTNDSIPIVDLYLMEVAREKGKKIRALENPKEQIQAVTVQSVNSQVKQLEKEIELFYRNDHSMDQLIDLYLMADIDQLYKMSDEYKMPKKLRNSLIRDRNIRMSKRIEGYINKISSFIAVGTLHLPGEYGLINLLREKGYKITAAAIVH